MTTTNDAPAQAIRCTYCGDTRTITDRVDGEITCPECGYDAPAPAPSGCGVRVKPLEWREGLHDMHYADPSTFVCNYVIIRTGCQVAWRPYDKDDWTQSTSLEEAKTAAQADYEARILSALASDASPRGEAWKAGQTVKLSVDVGYASPEASFALAAHPAPATVEMPDNLAELIEEELLAWRGANGAIHTIHACALGVSIKLRAALAPATEGRKS